MITFISGVLFGAAIVLAAYSVWIIPILNEAQEELEKIRLELLRK